MIGTSPVFQLPYNYHPRTYRLLWHQTLDEVLRYPFLPRKNINFDVYPVFKRKTNETKTLSSSIVTTHARTIEDTNITETWPANNLSVLAGFFYALKKFYDSPLSSGDYLIWFPFDKTDKAFAIIPLDFIAGSADEMSVEPLGSLGQNDYRFLKSDIHFKFKVLKIVDIPEAIALIEGT